MKRATWSIICAMIVIFSVTAGADASSRYVHRYLGRDRNQVGIINDCLDPSTPCRTIQHAIGQSRYQDQLMLSYGTYDEFVVIDVSRMPNQPSTWRSLTIDGGWNDDFTARDPGFYRTWVGVQQSGSSFMIDGTGMPVLQVTIRGIIMEAAREERGGAVYVRSGDAETYVSLVGNTFMNNVARYDGGAVYAYHGTTNPLTLNILSNVFTGNRCNSFDANESPYGYGGAISVRNYRGVVTLNLEENLIKDNVASSRGGALFVFTENGDATTNVNVFSNTMIGNDVYGWGSAVDVWASAGATALVRLENNVIADNSVTSGCGTVMMEAVQGSVINGDVTNNTIADNALSRSGLDTDTRGVPAGIITLNLANNVLWGNDGYGDLRIDQSTTVNAQHSNIGIMGTIMGTYVDLGGNVNVDPEFADPGNGNYRISRDSPMRDTGICGRKPLYQTEIVRVAPLRDLERDPRPDPGTFSCTWWLNRFVCGEGDYLGCDIGADEFVGSFVGVFRQGTWAIDFNDSDSWTSSVDKILGFGLSTDSPVTGDWNGDGLTEIGVFRNASWILDYNGNGKWDGPAADKVFGFGLSTDMPVAGNWDGSWDGRDKVGVFRRGAWYLDHDGNGAWDGPAVDRACAFGLATDKPVVGDWAGLGISAIGVFRGGTWALDWNANGAWDGPGIDRVYAFGLATDMPITGDWNGDGKTEIGVFRGGTWVLDMNGDGVWNGISVDKVFTYGLATDKPVTGSW